MDQPLAMERTFFSKGYQTIGGLDEVGRGCIAGPVVAACVVLDPNKFEIADKIDDSKKLSENKREALVPLITQQAIAIGIGLVDQYRIDKINILQASLEAMVIALKNCDVQPSLCLIDGNQKIKTSIEQVTVVQGDQKVVAIAAASIIAKVYRDCFMKDQAQKYPYYGFDKHKGYGTKLHKNAILQHGFCDLHRRSFRINF
ncbi:MAG: ribonuclease HII [Bdellovibrionales bacterium]|nr:ribonuclease HII [Bdellovibrionales bacterium]